MANVVYVACKRPNGFILEVERNDGRVEKITLNGAAKSPFYMPRSSIMPGLYGVTAIPVDFWEAWVTQNQDYPPYKNGEFFAQTKESAVKKEADERSTETTGLEALNPHKQQGVEPLKSV